jgi:hypothetical protein
MAPPSPVPHLAQYLQSQLYLAVCSFSHSVVKVRVSSIAEIVMSKILYIVHCLRPKTL